VVSRMQVNQNVQQVNMTTSVLNKGVYELIWNNGSRSSIQLVLVMRK
jgi:hypothetical protein